MIHFVAVRGLISSRFIIINRCPVPRGPHRTLNCETELQRKIMVIVLYPVPVGICADFGTLTRVPVGITIRFQSAAIMLERPQLLRLDGSGLGLVLRGLLPLQSEGVLLRFWIIGP